MFSILKSEKREIKRAKSPVASVRALCTGTLAVSDPRQDYQCLSCTVLALNTAKKKIIADSILPFVKAGLQY